MESKKRKGFVVGDFAMCNSKGEEATTLSEPYRNVKMFCPTCLGIITEKDLKHVDKTGNCVHCKSEMNYYLSALPED